MTVDQCKIVGSRGDGIDARGDGSSMLIKCTMIEDNGGSGVSAQRQVRCLRYSYHTFVQGGRCAVARRHPAPPHQWPPDMAPPAPHCRDHVHTERALDSSACISFVNAVTYCCCGDRLCYRDASLLHRV